MDVGAPGISILIPCRNDAVVLYDLLDSIERWAPEGMTYEVLVGDHDSTVAPDLDGSCAQLLDCSGCSTVGHVRNRLAGHAIHRVLLFLDADIVVTERWGDHVEEAAKRAMVTGIIIGSRPSPVGGIGFIGFIHNAWQRWLTPSYLGAAHMMMSAQTFDDLGGFDDLPTGEDVSICARADSIEHDNKLAVYHCRYPDDLPSFIRREVWHGVGDWQSIETVTQSKPLLAGIGLVVLLCMSCVAPAVVLPIVAAYLLALSFVMAPQVPLSWRLQHAGMTGVYLASRFASVFFRRRRKRTYDY